MELIFLEPIFQEKIWGGDKLQTLFDFEIPSKRTGEAWVISGHPHGISTISNPSKYQGMLLSDFYRDYSEYFGNPTDKEFPLLVKILDANDELSVQVHPNDEYGMTHEDELGKTECWYVIDAKPGSQIVYGHNSLTKKELSEAMHNEDWKNLLIYREVKPGDFFDVPAGTIHAIGSGIVILEIQQSSDTTYRVYDYNRLDNEGNLRDLHLDKSIEVASVPHEDSEFNVNYSNQKVNSIVHLIANQYFEVWKLLSQNSVIYKNLGPYSLVTIIDGEGEVFIEEESLRIKKGQSFIIPIGIETVEFKGKLAAIISRPVT